MPKLLSMMGLIISLIVLLPFLLDLAVKIPFKRSNITVDIVFIVCCAVLAYLSWSTMKEQI